MIPLADIAVRLFNAEMLLDEEHARQFASLIEGFLIPSAKHLMSIAKKADAEERPTTMAGVLSGRLASRYKKNDTPLFERMQGIALIPIEGSLSHKAEYGFFGRSTYELIQAQVAAAVADPAIKGIAYEVDSYGGEVSGAFETAEQIRRASVAKPSIALLTDHALSAGYLLASAARTIVMPQTGYAGSIGVVTMHVDISKLLEDVGVKVSVLTAGKYKAEGTPFEPLGDDAKTRIVSRLEKSRDIFAEAVGRHRGARFSKRQAMATEAAYFDAQDSVDLGLADAVGSPAEALAEFVQMYGSRF